jgi:hypothetical protein
MCTLALSDRKTRSRDWSVNGEHWLVVVFVNACVTMCRREPGDWKMGSRDWSVNGVQGLVSKRRALIGQSSSMSARRCVEWRVATGKWGAGVAHGLSGLLQSATSSSLNHNVLIIWTVVKFDCVCVCKCVCVCVCVVCVVCVCMWASVHTINTQLTLILNR